MEAIQIILKTKKLDETKKSLVPMYYNDYKRLIISEDGIFNRDEKYPDLDLDEICKVEELEFTETINI